MSSCKYVVLCIIFLTLIPCKIIFSQDIGIAQYIEVDTVVQNEIDIKYDSILAKATSSLTASAFQESIDYYKEASALKPGETYPYKMIRYVKDLEVRKKRLDELNRKSQIRDDLVRANQAIVDKNWSKAKSLFSGILTLHPEKKDEDYAKSKIEAIDLELKRIALRTPAKVEGPPAVAPPRNRREARAQRKLAERNAIIASASNRAKAQKQKVAVEVSSASLDSFENGNKSITVSPKRVPQPSTKGSLPDTMARAMPLTKDISESPGELKFLDITTGAVPPTKEISKPPVEASLPNTKVAVDTPLAKEILQPPTEASLPDRNVVGDTPLTKEMSEKPTKASQPDRNVVVNTPSTKKVVKKPVGSLPDRKVAVSSTSNAGALPAETQFSEKKGDSLVLPTEQTEGKPTEVPLLKLADSSNYVKMTCQDISFIGTNAYIKILVQNFSDSTRFLTDTLKVSIRKNNGIEKKLDQRFISNFPVVMPQKELVLVYFADAVTVESDDIFVLQMEDKLKQTKFLIEVPWNLYKQRKSF